MRLFIYQDEKELALKQQIIDSLDLKLLPQGYTLQWFAAEDEGRTEDPTEHKIRKAREEGKVVKSNDLVGAICLLFSILGLWIFGKSMFNAMAEMMRSLFKDVGVLNPAKDINVMEVLFFSTVRIVGPFVAICFFSAIIANVMQVGFLFTTKPIEPDFKKIIPRLDKFFKKAFFSGEAAFNTLKSLIKVAVIVVISVLNIMGEFETIIYFYNLSLPDAFEVILGLGLKIMIQATLALIAFSVPDYFFERHKHRESLKMTKQEIKEERKMMDGDPLIKSRLRERMREILSTNVIKSVAGADVVITNPTHFAVALEWNKDSMFAPVLVAKGHDELAMSIKSIARQNDVTIVENKPLARALYAELEVGDEIPEKYYEVVSIILAEIYTLQGKAEYAI
ncbi:MAG: flagellar biosynthesis protein FlhB [Spirochaetales bacterium]|nr:flagellar biosynthesis protein FlhB [Spirochaetales bacterium]